MNLKILALISIIFLFSISVAFAEENQIDLSDNVITISPAYGSIQDNLYNSSWEDYRYCKLPGSMNIDVANSQINWYDNAIYNLNLSDYLDNHDYFDGISINSSDPLPNADLDNRIIIFKKNDINNYTALEYDVIYFLDLNHYLDKDFFNMVETAYHNNVPMSVIFPATNGPKVINSSSSPNLNNLIIYGLNDNYIVGSYDSLVNSSSTKLVKTFTNNSAANAVGFRMNSAGDAGGYPDNSQNSTVLTNLDDSSNVNNQKSDSINDLDGSNNFTTASAKSVTTEATGIPIAILVLALLVSVVGFRRKL